MTKFAWLFPGQGTQFIGMGRALHDAHPAARAIFERADAALGFSITQLCFEGPEEQLNLTQCTQPAILTVSIAALAALKAALPELPRPALAAGHSLGEYSALVACGALSFEDAVRITHLRGKCMQAAVPEGEGGMVAILGASSELAESLCSRVKEYGVAQPANYNAPGQIVVAGSARAMDAVASLALEHMLKMVPLNVSAPFHSPLMASAARQLEPALRALSVGELEFPVISNVDARPNADSAKVVELLLRQVTAPVLWHQTMTNLANCGVSCALEIGPGRVLAGLGRRIDKSVKILGVSEPDDLTSVTRFFNSRDARPEAVTQG